MPSNLRFVSQLFQGGRSIGPRRNFSSPAKKNESLLTLLERNPAFYYSAHAGFIACNLSQTYRMLKVWRKYVEDDKKREFATLRGPSNEFE